ncbi:MAG: hypothetical protein N3H31_07105 [Candidatus Nezhaarchaeota archaeon]|nr:hypothetical protein [Candidatus Nezhaarchaeota archaeon]
MSKAVIELKEVFREVMLQVFECEDKLVLELSEPKVKEAVRKAFEELRLQLTRVYVKRLKEKRREGLDILIGGLSTILLPSRLIPRPPRNRNRAKAWIEKISSLLEDYNGAIKQLSKREA